MSSKRDIQVRPVTDGDIPAWAHLTATTVDAGTGVSEAEIADEMAHASPFRRQTAYVAWLAELGEGERAIARLRLSQQGERAEVWGIGVAQDAVTRGLEPEIIRAIEAYAHYAAARHLLIQTVPERVAVIRRAGYTLKKARVEMAADLVWRPVVCDRPLRHPRPDDEAEIQAIGLLYYDAYHGTIDDEGETPDEALAEARRCLTGGYAPFLADCSFVLEGDNRPAGAVLITEEGDNAVLLAEVIVDSRYRGRGYARALIQSAMNACLERGWRRMWLMVTRRNVPAEALYRRMGFREEPGSEVYHLEKEL